jgi:hypothetical protein
LKDPSFATDFLDEPERRNFAVEVYPPYAEKLKPEVGILFTILKGPKVKKMSVLGTASNLFNVDIFDVLSDAYLALCKSKYKDYLLLEADLH